MQLQSEVVVHVLWELPHQHELATLLTMLLVPWRGRREQGKLWRGW